MMVNETEQLLHSGLYSQAEGKDTSMAMIINITAQNAYHGPGPRGDIEWPLSLIVTPLFKMGLFLF